MEQAEGFIRKNKFYLAALAGYAFLFLFLCSKMSPLYVSNEWSDVNIYFTIGQSIINGKTLYVDVFDPKGPLIFIIYGIGYLISNDSFIGLFLFFLIGWSAALTLIFYLTDYLLNSKPLALAVAAFTPPFALSYMHSGGSPEEIILLLHLFCISLLVKSDRLQIKRREFAVLGACSAAVICLKFNLIFFLAISTIALFYITYLSGRKKAFWQQVLFFIAGVSAIFIPVCAYLVATGAFGATIDTYIILNKKLAVTVPFVQLIKDGVKRILAMFTYYPVGATVIFLGAFIYPLLYLKRILLKVSYILGALSLYGIIFFAGVAQFYYPLPLYVFLPLGLIVIIKFFKIDRLRVNRLAEMSIVCIAILLCAYRIQFWNMSLDQLLRKEPLPGLNYAFAKIINEEPNPTLLSLTYGDAVNVFTLCNITPNVKYFSSLNIPYEIYPVLRNEQVRYIADKEVQFIIINEQARFFANLDVLHQNYEVVGRYAGLEEYQNVRFPKTALLYKRKD